MLAELGILVTIGMMRFVLQPQLAQSQIELPVGPQLLVDVLIVWRRTWAESILDQRLVREKTLRELGFAESVMLPPRLSPAMAALLR